MRFHAIQNVETALRFLRYKEIKLVNIRGEDIVDGNPKLTLGLIWTIILHFQVGAAIRQFVLRARVSHTFLPIVTSVKCPNDFVFAAASSSKMIVNFVCGGRTGSSSKKTRSQTAFRHGKLVARFPMAMLKVA
jgi:hypothetical protein